MKEIDKRKVRTYQDLNVYQQAYNLAMQIFEITKEFLKEEAYSLVDQIRRSSRSVPVNIADGYSKRKHRNMFLKYLVDANGSCEETKVWVDFAGDCRWIIADKRVYLRAKYDEVGAMLNSLIKN